MDTWADRLFAMFVHIRQLQAHDRSIIDGFKYLLCGRIVCVYPPFIVRGTWVNVHSLISRMTLSFQSYPYNGLGFRTSRITGIRHFWISQVMILHGSCGSHWFKNEEHFIFIQRFDYVQSLIVLHKILLYTSMKKVDSGMLIFAMVLTFYCLS